MDSDGAYPKKIRVGNDYVVDSIETDGAEMLFTKTCESEIALGVSGRDINCAGHRWAMMGLSRRRVGVTLSILERFHEAFSKGDS